MSDLAMGTGSTKPTVSHHIRALGEAGLIKWEIVGREKLLAPNPDCYPNIVGAVLDERLR